MRIYLVPSDVAGSIHSRFSPKVHFVGRLAPGRDGRGVLRFRVPPLDTGRYTAAAWSPGKPFFVQTKGVRVRMPAATETCPVTAGGRYSNGLLATRLPADGIIGAQQRPEGLFQKLGWDALATFAGTLAVRGERLDGPGEMRFVRANRGSAVWTGLYGWMTPVYFSSEGCWRIAARVDDVTLSYVVKVVATG